MKEQIKEQLEEKFIEVAVKISFELIELGAQYALKLIREKKQQLTSA